MRDVCACDGMGERVAMKVKEKETGRMVRLI